jgi:hypothetical protein
MKRTRMEKYNDLCKRRRIVCPLKSRREAPEIIFEVRDKCKMRRLALSSSRK